MSDFIQNSKLKTQNSIQSIGIFAAAYKPHARELAAELQKLAQARGLQVRMQHNCAKSAGCVELGCSDEEVVSSDVVVTFSGDGGVLSAARLAAPHGTPILAVDLGRLGFLSAVRPSELRHAFEMLMNGEFEIEERMMLDADVLRNGDQTPQHHAIGLNDAVVAKSALARILRLSIYVEGDLVAAVRADGLVVSTPTGSTAYALSAGGPIVHPGVPLLLICPICAHSLTQRPLVVAPEETVEIVAEWDGEEVEETSHQAMLTVDGQIGIELHSGDRVQIRRAEVCARLLHPKNDSFYTRLREKMRWGF